MKSFKSKMFQVFDFIFIFSHFISIDVSPRISTLIFSHLSRTGGHFEHWFVSQFGYLFTFFRLFDHLFKTNSKSFISVFLFILWTIMATLSLI